MIAGTTDASIAYERWRDTRLGRTVMGSGEVLWSRDGSKLVEDFLRFLDDNGYAITRRDDQGD